MEVIELMPPMVKTELSSEFPEGAFAMITTEELKKRTLTTLKARRHEIRPGQSNLVAFMRRFRSRRDQPDVLAGIARDGADRARLGPG